MNRRISLQVQEKGFILPFIMVILFLALIIVLSVHNSLRGSLTAVNIGKDKSLSNVMTLNTLKYIENEELDLRKTREEIEGLLNQNGGEYRCKPIPDFDPSVDVGFNCQSISMSEIEKVLESIQKDLNNLYSDGKGFENKVETFRKLSGQAEKTGSVVYYTIRGQERISRERSSYLFVITIISSHLGVPSVIEAGYIVYPQRISTGKGKDSKSK